MKYGKATTITSDERLILIGLLSLAKLYRAKLRDIEPLVRKIIQEDDDALGHTTDFVWGDEGDVDQLLKLEEIKVVD